MSWLDSLPAADLRGYTRQDLVRDLGAGAAVAFLAVPQGVAYALVAGLPPAMGLYAATLPTLAGSLVRSSRHVVTGPTNAVSLLVGAGLASGVGDDPAGAALTLAAMVGALQLAAGLLRLGGLVHFVSHPVVLGYITGAAVLIAVGQLPNVTATPGGGETFPGKLWTWAQGLGATSGLSVAVTVGTIAGIVAVRWWRPRLPAAALALAGAIGLTLLLDLPSQGLRVLADIAPIPRGLPRLTIPRFDRQLVQSLFPLAGAVTLLSMTESTAIARSIAARTGQRLDLSLEFVGEGVANTCAALVGGYPTTGSLTRSAVNVREGAVSRLAGVFSGVFVLLALVLVGPLLGATPIAALAGLLIVVAARLIDVDDIRSVLRSHGGDRAAFLLTLGGCFLLHLDQAIYLGVALSLVGFLQRATLLSLRDLVVDSRGYLREVSARDRRQGQDGYVREGVRYGGPVHVINVAGSMFFGATGELEQAMDTLEEAPWVQVLIVRLKRARHLDVTTVGVLVDTARRLHAEGRHLLLVGLSDGAVGYLDRIGALDEIGRDNLFPSGEHGWFEALAQAMEEGFRRIDDPEARANSAFGRWLDRRAGREEG